MKSFWRNMPILCILASIPMVLTPFASPGVFAAEIKKERGKAAPSGSLSRDDSAHMVKKGLELLDRGHKSAESAFEDKRKAEAAIRLSNAQMIKARSLILQSQRLFQQARSLKRRNKTAAAEARMTAAQKVMDDGVRLFNTAIEQIRLAQSALNALFQRRESARVSIEQGRKMVKTGEKGL